MTVDLYLVRHAEAAEAPEGAADDARPLTGRGRREFARAVKGLRRQGVRLDRILHSPLLRAVETADLLVPLLRDGETAVTPRLAEPPSEALLQELGAPRTALVGHQPWLGQLCAWLVAADPGRAEAFPFPKGGVAHLEGEPQPGGMRLRALWSPDLLERLR